MGFDTYECEVIHFGDANEARTYIMNATIFASIKEQRHPE